MKDKKDKKDKPIKYCETCVHATPLYEKLNYAKQPILATCPYSKDQVLLRNKACESNYKRKQNE
jgi:hypothetical protein